MPILSIQEKAHYLQYLPIIQKKSNQEPQASHSSLYQLEQPQQISTTYFFIFFFSKTESEKDSFIYNKL